LGGAALTLGRVEGAVGVDLALEPGKERGPAWCRGLAGVALGVHGVGREPCP
jgi:hypothetical protein